MNIEIPIIEFAGQSQSLVTELYDVEQARHVLRSLVAAS